MRRKILSGIVIALMSLFVWLAWPIYGFLSNQYEVARLPWGWNKLPDQATNTSHLHNPAYSDAGIEAEKILAKRRKKISAPSLSAAVAIDGELVWAGAVGLSDIKAKKAATPETVYRIGSTSKLVGITGLARLVSAETINLDAPISTYSTGLPNQYWENFTSRQLASHTAGLTTYEENNDWLGFYQSLALTSRFNDPIDALSVFDGADILYPSGDRFHYSGYDNVLLSAVMQASVDEPFDDLMHDYVFNPLGLKSIQPDYHRQLNSEVAVSYQVKGVEFKPWRKVDLSHKLAAGGYVSTPSDLALLGIAWLDDDFIPPGIRKQFWTPVQLSNGEVNDNDYALGFRRKSWNIKGAGEVEHLNHGGISKGAQCWLMIIPEHNMSIAISTNRRTDAFFDFADVYVDLLEVFIPATDQLAK